MPKKKIAKQKSSSALVLGILSIVFSLILPVPLGLIFGVFGLIKAQKKDEQESPAVALACSIIGLSISVVYLLLFLIVLILMLIAVLAYVNSSGIIY